MKHAVCSVQSVQGRTINKLPVRYTQRTVCDPFNNDSKKMHVCVMCHKFSRGAM